VRDGALVLSVHDAKRATQNPAVLIWAQSAWLDFSAFAEHVASDHSVIAFTS
jgi:hypothetical protein